MKVLPIFAFPLRHQLVTNWPISADSSLETSSPSFFFEFDSFVTSDVCTTGVWCSSYHDDGAIDDGSGGRHSALFTPAPSSAFCCFPPAVAAEPDNCQKRYNFESFGLSSETSMCSVFNNFHSHKPNQEHIYCCYCGETLCRPF